MTLEQHYHRRRRMMARATSGRSAAGRSFVAVLTQREVSLILGVSVKTVRGCEARAIKKLRGLLEGIWQEAQAQG